MIVCYHSSPEATCNTFAIGFSLGLVSDLCRHITKSNRPSHISACVWMIPGTYTED
jgi:hypothetical protein